MWHNNTLSSAYRWGLIATAIACVVVVLGAFTRLSDAGLGCPDWPGCYGHLTWPKSDDAVARAEARFPEFPVEHDKTWPEMVHRYFAGFLGLIILGIEIVATSSHRASLGRLRDAQPVVAIHLALRRHYLAITQRQASTIIRNKVVGTVEFAGGHYPDRLGWLDQFQLRRTGLH